MSIHIDGKKIAAMYWGGQKIREAWYEGRRVFSGKPVEVMPATVDYWDAQDWLHSKLYEYGEDYTTVTELPFEIDTGEATNMQEMFSGCSSLTAVPDMDTARVTNMAYMFSGCSSLTTVPDMDTARVTNMAYMFSGCSSLTTVPDMDTARVTNMEEMFSGCSSLTAVPEMETSKVTSMAYMFDGCESLTTVPAMNTSNVTDVRYMFSYCSSLTDGNVRLIGKRRRVDTTGMIQKSGLTREPFYDSNGRPI